MKKVVIIISVILITQLVKGQSNITDTTQYLRDSIEARKTYFSSTGFNHFLNQLQVGIKYYSVGLPLPEVPDTLVVDRIVLYFNRIEDIIAKDLVHTKTPYIEVSFTSPILIPKAYLERGALLDAGTDWNVTKANFFANKVISQVNVLGL